MSTSDTALALRSAAEVLAEAVTRDDPGSVPDRDLQMLFAAVARAYALKIDRGEKLAAFTPADGVTATDVAVAASGMLAAVEMAVFELGMWQTIKGIA